MTARLFQPGWFPEPKRHITEADEWTEMPDGRGNIILTAIAGAMRKQGMDYPTLLRQLLLVNKTTMTRDPMPGEMVEQIARSVCRYDPDPDIEIELVDEEAAAVEEENDPNADELFTPFSLLPDPTPIEWLWHPYIPAGRLVMIEGREGIGKGMMAVWLAMRTITGAPYVPGGEVRDPRPVLWFSSEDDPRDDIQPRLLAAGALKGQHEEILFQDLRAGNWAFPKNLNTLEKRIRRYQPGMVIFDPGRSYLAPKSGEESFNNEAALRPGMQALLHTAQDFNVTIVFVHHQNKRGEGTARERSTGSGVFRQVARQVLTLEMVGTNRALAIDKANHIDMANTVHSWDVREVPGTGVAQFVLGGKLPDFKTIDEWRETMQKGEGEIKVEMSLDDLKEAMRGIDCDTIAPAAAQIAKDLGVTVAKATTLRRAAVSAGLIDQHNRWKGC